MEVGVFGAMMMGALPALLLMFYMLGPFEGLFEELSSFFAFVIGMVAGVVVLLAWMAAGMVIYYYFRKRGNLPLTHTPKNQQR